MSLPLHSPIKLYRNTINVGQGFTVTANSAILYFGELYLLLIDIVTHTGE